MRAVNMGALRSLPVYRASRVFPGLGQEDPFYWNNLDTADSSGADGLVTQEALRDELDQNAVDQQLMSDLQASRDEQLFREQQANPSVNAPASSKTPASSSPDILTSIGKFFTGLFTPSNVQAAASAVKSVEDQKAAAKKGPIGLPATVPILGSQVDTGTLLVVGGLAVGAVVVISVAR
jgi:hypothetical protein